jgi:O2-independent ubiquinone biosynthesis accessory factor UbiT
MLRPPAIDSIMPLLAKPLRLLPHGAQRLPLEILLERAFQAGVSAGALDFLADRCLAIEIEDTGWRWPVTLDGGRLRVLERNREAQVTIRGRSVDFLAMAAKLEDPDTLFFQRRLVIEGDTELGLEAKNFLYGLDEEQLPAPLVLALRGVRELDGLMPGSWRLGSAAAGLNPASAPLP